MITTTIDKYRHTMTPTQFKAVESTADFLEHQAYMSHQTSRAISPSAEVSRRWVDLRRYMLIACTNAGMTALPMESAKNVLALRAANLLAWKRRLLARKQEYDALNTEHAPA